MQAALLASIDEEVSGEKQGGKASRKKGGGKKGKRSKKNATLQHAENGGTNNSAPQQAGLSSQDEENASDEQQSEGESETSTVHAESMPGKSGDKRASALTEDAHTRDSHATCSGYGDEVEEEWKVVTKPARKPTAKGPALPKQAQQQQQQGVHRAGQAGKEGAPGSNAGSGVRAAPPYKRCPSVTSLSDSTCSLADSDQSMASASTGVGAPAPTRPGKPMVPTGMPPPPAVLNRPAGNAAADAPAGVHARDAVAASGASAQGGNRSGETWAARVAGSKGRSDLQQPPTPCEAGPGSSCGMHAPAAGEPNQVAPKESGCPSCRRCSEELAAARAGAEAERQRSAELAAEVERLRTALAAGAHGAAFGGRGAAAERRSARGHGVPTCLTLLGHPVGQ